MYKRISLKQIAQIAGVSKVVVYTVLKGRENKGIFVSNKTKEKILKIANELGYVAPKSAKELFTGNSDTIGIIFHKLTPYFSYLVSEIQTAALKEGLEIIPYITNGDWQLEKHYLEISRDGRVDGVITVAHTDKSQQLYKQFTQKPYNLKILSFGPDIKDIPTIHFDEKKAGVLAAKHLIEIGCKSFAFFGGDRKLERCKGFVEYLKEKGYTAVVFTAEKFVSSFEEGMKLGEEFFKLKKLPEGVFAANDILGVTLVNCAKRYGIKIPDDMAIMGCDNTEVCLYSEPELTSIDTNVKEIARKAIEIIKRLIKGEKIEEPVRIDVQIVKRNSTKRR